MRIVIIIMALCLCSAINAKEHQCTDNSVRKFDLCNLWYKDKFVTENSYEQKGKQPLIGCGPGCAINIFYPIVRVRAQYYIKDKVLWLTNDGMGGELEKIDIIELTRKKLVLKFYQPNLTQTYYSSPSFGHEAFPEE